VSDFGWSAGGQVPHEEASTREHFDQVGDAVRHEREADRASRDRPKRPWWKFWAKRVPR
jgi:hypothetical protein